MRIADGKGGLPKLTLAAGKGASAEVYLYGGHVTSWRPSAGRERLFISACSEFRHGIAIRGGVPVIFPQFAGFGTLPKHGFARTAMWRVIDCIESGAQMSVRLGLEDSTETRALWPHPFALELAITLGANTLALALTVTNTGTSAFSFTGALHTYLRIAELATLSIAGLDGLQYLDSAKGGAPGLETQELLTIDHEIDRIYLAVPPPIEVFDDDLYTVINTTGFRDTVVWNPGPVKSRLLTDLERGGERFMVCIEAAIVAEPITLGPGEHWRGTQTLHAAEVT